MVTPASVAIGATLAAGAILRATQEEALLSGPEYIRDGQPEGLTRRIGLGLARAACQRYANNPGSLNSDRATSFENACRPYLDSLGGGSGAEISKPFEGGQCIAPYQVSVSWFVEGGTPENQSTGFRASGPIGGASLVDVGGSKRLRAVAGGTAQLAFECGPVSPFIAPGTVTQFASPVIDSRATNVQIAITPCGADDCGNPPPEVVPPTPPTVPFPFPVPIVIAPEVNIDADVQINADGTIEFNIGTGPITIDPFGGDGDGGDTGSGGADDSPPAPEPGPELPGGNGGFGGDDPFGEPPAGRRWVGACITITNRPTNQPPIPGTPPEDVYAAVVGNVRLVYNAAGNRQTDTPVRIQAKKVCVWEAVRKLNPVGVSVDLQPGFGYSYRPYSVPLDA